MLYYRRFVIIAVAVLTVGLFTSVHGCSQAAGDSAKSTSTEFSSNAGASGTTQPLAAPTSTDQAYRYIYVNGTLNYMAGSIDETITVNGSMIRSERKGDEGNLVGVVEVTLRHHVTGPVPGVKGQGELFWNGSDPSGTIHVTLPASTGKAPALRPFSAFDGGTGVITSTCKGTGYTVPSGDPKYMFKEMAFTIDFVLTVTSGGINITVLDPGYSGSLTATAG